MRIQVRSLAFLSGLRIVGCCGIDLYRSQMWLKYHSAVAVMWASGYSSNWTPSLRTSICHGYSPKKTKKNKRKRKKKSHQCDPICSFTHHMHAEHPLCVRHCAGCWGQSHNICRQSPCPREPTACPPCLPLVLHRQASPAWMGAYD